MTDLEKLEAAEKILDRSFIKIKIMTVLDSILEENGKPPLSEEDVKDPNSTNRIADGLIRDGLIRLKQIRKIK